MDGKDRPVSPVNGQLLKNERVSLLKDTPCVYFISDGQSHCKIGVASDIKTRFVTIQVGNPIELTVKKVVYTDTLDDAYEKEREYHSALIAHRIRGEWFDEDAVNDYLSGKEKEDNTVYMCDVCPEFSIFDAAKLFMIGLESKNAVEFCQRYDAEMPEYWKKYDRERLPIQAHRRGVKSGR